jgi:hypothetical protein
VDRERARAKGKTCVLWRTLLSHYHRRKKKKVRFKQMCACVVAL